MSFIKNNYLSIKRKKREKRRLLKKVICLFIILTFLLNFIIINDLTDKNLVSSENDEVDKIIKEKEPPNNPLPSANDQQDPFTINFEDMWNAIRLNFKSSWPSTGFNETYIGETNNPWTPIGNDVN
ncbi:MAG: hypothetical protein EU539_11825, partial [Promethearchaeota archaeon]